MSDIIACCVETDPGKEYELKRSAEICGINLHVFGLGQPWEGFLTKTRIYIEELSKLKYKYALCLDSRDVLFYNTNLRKILKAYLKHYPHKKVIFNGETNCYPYKGYYNRYVSDHKYRFLNSGCFIGETRFIVKMMEAAMQLSETDEHFPQDDQHLYTTVYLRNQVTGPIGIDEKCVVFQTLWDENGGRSANFDLVYNENYIYNQLTETYPMIFHYPGPTGHGETVKKVIDKKLNVLGMFQ